MLVDKRGDQVSCLLEQLLGELDHLMLDREYRDRTLHVVVRKGACEQLLPEALDAAGVWDKPVLAIVDSFGGGIETLPRSGGKRA